MKLGKKYNEYLIECPDLGECEKDELGCIECKVETPKIYNYCVKLLNINVSNFGEKVIDKCEKEKKLVISENKKVWFFPKELIEKVSNGQLSKIRKYKIINPDDVIDTIQKEINVRKEKIKMINDWKY